MKQQVQTILESVEDETMEMMDAVRELLEPKYHLGKLRYSGHTRLIMAGFATPNDTEITIWVNPTDVGISIHITFRGITDNLDGFAAISLMDDIRKTLRPDADKQTVIKTVVELVDELHNRLLIDMEEHLETVRRITANAYRDRGDRNPKSFRAEMVVAQRPINKAMNKLISMKR
jgi:hypothetical protein